MAPVSRDVTAARRILMHMWFMSLQVTQVAEAEPVRRGQGTRYRCGASSMDCYLLLVSEKP